jgi:arylsulfatase
MRHLGFIALASAFGCGSATVSQGGARRPNVIIVLSDDQGYGDFSAHGNPVLKTPHLDALRAQSVRLTDFHVAPMCTPTRGQLMSGMDALRNGATSVCAGRSYIRRGIPTMAELFASSGYRTAMFGKWHLGDSYPNLPHHRGFQEAVYHSGWGITSIADVWGNDCFDGRYRHNGVLKKYPGFCTDVWFDLGMNWIRERRSRGEPFFLYLPTNAPHSPHWVPARYKQPYAGLAQAGFFGMIANLDENVGRLDAFLAAQGLRDDTILIYFHDNGGTSGVAVHNAGMRGRKSQYYEGGHRAACFIRWPGGGLEPRDADALTQVQDLLPTLVDLCRLATPARARFDGVSLAGLLRDPAAAPPDRMLVVQYGQLPIKGQAAVLWNKWRLVLGKELYNLAEDPGQARDVAAAHSDVFRRMSEHYETWWSAVGPLVDDLEPVSVGAEQENPVCLTSSDWANVYCDNMRDLREGLGRNGPWHVRVERDGRYTIALRRWPREAGAAITAAVPPFQGVDGGLQAGKAMPIAKVRLKVAGLDETRAVGPEDREVTFAVDLKSAPKLPMQSWFYDAEGNELSGAYFAYVRRD